MSVLYYKYMFICGYPYVHNFCFRAVSQYNELMETVVIIIVVLVILFYGSSHKKKKDDKKGGKDDRGKDEKK